MKCVYFTICSNEDYEEGITTILFHNDSTKLYGLVENSINDQVYWCCTDADIFTIFIALTNNKDGFRIYMYYNVVRWN